MWTNICTILQTMILISADRTGKNFKKVLPVSLWAVCAASVCFVCCRLLCVFMWLCAVKFTESSDCHTWAEQHRWIEPHYQRCLKTRLCFMFRLKGFASICSETAPEVKSGDLQTLGKWRHAALMFHLSQPHNSNSTFMHLHWQSCMKYNPAVYIRCSGVVVAGVSKLPCVQQSAAERRGWQMGEQVVSDYGWIIIMSACWSRGGKMAEGLIGASLRQLSRQIDASACWDEDDML